MRVCVTRLKHRVRARPQRLRWLLRRAAACSGGVAASSLPRFFLLAACFTGDLPAPLAADLPFAAVFGLGTTSGDASGADVVCGGGGAATAGVRESCQRTPQCRGRSDACAAVHKGAWRNIARTDFGLVRAVRQEDLLDGGVVTRHGKEAAALVEAGHYALEAHALHAAADGIFQRRPVRHVRAVCVARATAAAAARAPRVAGRAEAAGVANVAPACASHAWPESLHQRQARCALCRRQLLGFWRDARR